MAVILKMRFDVLEPRWKIALMDFLNLFSLNSIQVYHGSDMLVKEPKIMQPMIQFLRHLSHMKMEF